MFKLLHIFSAGMSQTYCKAVGGALPAARSGIVYARSFVIRPRDEYLMRNSCVRGGTKTALVGGGTNAQLQQMRQLTLHSFCILISSVVSPSILKLGAKLNRHKNSRNSQYPKSGASRAFWLALMLVLA